MKAIIKTEEYEHLLFTKNGVVKDAIFQTWSLMQSTRIYVNSLYLG